MSKCNNACNFENSCFCNNYIICFNAKISNTSEAKNCTCSDKTSSLEQYNYCECKFYHGAQWFYLVCFHLNCFLCFSTCHKPKMKFLGARLGLRWVVQWFKTGLGSTRLFSWPYDVECYLQAKSFFRSALPHLLDLIFNLQ